MKFSPSNAIVCLYFVQHSAMTSQCHRSTVIIYVYITIWSSISSSKSQTQKTNFSQMYSTNYVYCFQNFHSIITLPRLVVSRTSIRHPRLSTFDHRGTERRRQRPTGHHATVAAQVAGTQTAARGPAVQVT